MPGSVTTTRRDPEHRPANDLVRRNFFAEKPDELWVADITQFASRVPGLQLHFTVEEVEPFSVWPGYRGRQSQIMLGLMAPDYLEREVFCCGPEPFMRAVREMPGSLGFDMARYHEESFAARVLEEIPVETAVPAAISEITFAGSGKAMACDGTDTVLTVAKQAGLNIPSSCNFGLCGTCKVKKLSGRWRWSTTAAFRTRKLRKVSSLPAARARKAV